ncbi:nucleosome remodeling complex, CAF-I subunit [Piedraia hortae CBS 480.64]|uniref:Nucleosome remodeling complex, CAF-I subunit n=1 Tax=Piedraia hortae CBS 480.64 TaxID=1314780 RepID=A0A6A7BYU6_9PEZI|nr:nucleosome remodeling complex, CAF-I subunit [Piedraia hortae CBS 480.64]
MDDEEAKIIAEEYKTWRDNAIPLYDILYSTALKWPTLTTQWLPDVRQVPGKEMRRHRLLLGTHTSNQDRELIQIVHLDIANPKPATVADYDANTEELGGYGASRDPMSWEVVQTIVHPTEVNRARYQPQNPNIIASWASNCNLYIWDRTKHSSNPSSNDAKPQATLSGHTAEGFALDWNSYMEGQLISGSNDSTVKLWDLVVDFTPDNKDIEAQTTYAHHSASVNDVQFHPKFGKELFGSVSDDLSVAFVDMRTSSTDRPAITFENAHSAAINSLAFHPKMESLFATASDDKTVGVFDLRFPSKGRLHTLDGHKQVVTKVEWHPTDSSILASSSDDRRVIIWDMSRVGMEQMPEEAEEGVPELLFMHAGNASKLTDFSWNPNDPWVLCSASDNNVFQVWRPTRHVVDAKPRTFTKETLE